MTSQRNATHHRETTSRATSSTHDSPRLTRRVSSMPYNGARCRRFARASCRSTPYRFPACSTQNSWAVTLTVIVARICRRCPMYGALVSPRSMRKAVRVTTCRSPALTRKLSVHCSKTCNTASSIPMHGKACLAPGSSRCACYTTFAALTTRTREHEAISVSVDLRIRAAMCA